MLIVFDTASLYFRAFFGLPSTLRASNGQPVNAAHGLLDMIAHLINVYRPAELACAWDNDWRPAWRVELVPSYKAHRVAAAVSTTVVGAGGIGAQSSTQETADADLVSQVPVIIGLLDAVGLPIVGVDGYEADDVLATLAGEGLERGLEVVVVTGDRDLFQLVRTGCRVAYLSR